MTEKMTLPSIVDHDKESAVLGAFKWGFGLNLVVHVRSSNETMGFIVDFTLPDGTPLSKVIFAIKKVAGMYGARGVTLSSIMNYSTVTRRATSLTIQGVVDQLCRTGELVRIDGVHKQSGKPLPRYKLGE